MLQFSLKQISTKEYNRFSFDVGLYFPDVSSFVCVFVWSGERCFFG